MSIEIEELLHHWNKTKEEIANLEQKCDKYKKLAERMMIDQGTNTLTSNDFTLSRKTLSRETLTKTDVPSDVWSMYSRRVSYPAYYLKSRHKQTTKKRSPKKKKLL